MRTIIFLAMSFIYLQAQARDFRILWKNFEVGGTRIQQSGSAYSDGPLLAFTPDSNMKPADYWITLRPRLDLQFGKDLAAKVFPIYSLGLQVRINFTESFYLAPEFSAVMATPSTGNKSFSSAGLWLGYNLNEFMYLDRVALGYRKFNTGTDTSQLGLIVGIDFN